MRSRSTHLLDYADYAAIPEDGMRHEILAGVHYVTPAPNVAHQHASKRLMNQVLPYFEGSGIGEVFFAPFDVMLSPHDIVQPDLVVVPTELLSNRGVEGVPLLAVEILSPSSRSHDRIRKARRYAALGLPHFWIVDPDAKRVECYRLKDRRYVLVTSGAGVAALAHPDWPGLLIELASLWR